MGSLGTEILLHQIIQLTQTDCSSPEHSYIIVRLHY